MPAAPARALRPAELLEERLAAEAAAKSERLALWESKAAIAGVVVTIVATLVSVVWMLATLNANVEDLRGEIPRGSIPAINATLSSIDRRLEHLEEQK